MAMQLKTVTNKLFNPALRIVRNRSRFVVPAVWEDPNNRRQRNFFSEFWNTPSRFDFISPIQRFGIPTFNWEGESCINNPKDGFQVSLNVKNFSPNEIDVKVVDNSIFVGAKHEERAENGENYISRHFTRRYVLPDNFRVEDVVSTLSSDGILTVKVPPRQRQSHNVRKIQIQQTGSPARSSNQGEGQK